MLAPSTSDNASFSRQGFPNSVGSIRWCQENRWVGGWVVGRFLYVGSWGGGGGDKAGHGGFPGVLFW